MKPIGPESGSPERQFADEKSAFAWLALNSDRAAMRFHYLANNVESQAESTDLVAGHGSFKPIKNVSLKVFRNTDPIIPDAEPCQIGGLDFFDCYFDRPASSVFDRIREQVVKNLPDPAVVPVAHDQLGSVESDAASDVRG